MAMPRELELLPRHSINHIEQRPECLLVARSGPVTRVCEGLLCEEERTLKRKRLGVFRSVNKLERGNVGMTCPQTTHFAELLSLSEGREYVTA